MIIDCSQCEFFESEQCADCFVRVVLSHRDRATPLVLDRDEEEAIAALEEVGLIPVLKFKRKAG